MSKFIFSEISIPFFIPYILLVLFYINGSYQLFTKERLNKKKILDFTLLKNIIISTFCILLLLVILNYFNFVDNEINQLIRFIFWFAASSYLIKIISNYIFGKKIPKNLWIVYSSKDFFNQIETLSAE